MCVVMSSRNVTDPVKKKLFGNSANYCNLCSLEGQFKRFVNLEMAHIIAFSDDPSAPRYVQGKSGDNSYENLILLCPNHHSEVDHKENAHKYTIEYLIEKKQIHETLFSQKNLTFEASNDSFLLDKIHKNINFQTILNALEWRPSFVTEDVFKLSSFIDIINSNSPTYFPFNAKVFNNLTEMLYENWISLKQYLMDQNMFNHLMHNREFKMKLVSTIDYHTIRLNCLSIVYALKRWIDIVRYTYKNITL